MKKASRFFLTATLAMSAPQLASAANWLKLQGTEPAGVSAPVRVWGFIQPTYAHNFGDPVTGLAGGLAPYNGQVPLFSRVAPDNKSQSTFLIQRARLGIRGVMTPIDERINYFLLAEFGNNGITRESDVALSDASVTFNYIPGARIRVGQFKYPAVEEGLQAIQVFNYINFTSVTDTLMNERFVAATPAGNRVVGSVGAFRDVGVQVFDWFNKDNWEFSYAAMLGNGNGINRTDDNKNKEFTGRVDFGYVFKGLGRAKPSVMFGGKGPRREEVKAWIWHQEGSRTYYDGSEQTRMRQGFGARYNRDPFRVTAEYLRGRGMIFTGVNPPFSPVSGATLTPAPTVAVDGEADGWYTEMGYAVLPKLELDVRYDQFNRMTNSAAAERKFSTWTLGGQYFFHPKARLTLNYEIRDLKVVNPGAVRAPGANPTAAQNAVARQNAETIAAAMDNRVSAQVTFIF